MADDTPFDTPQQQPQKRPPPGGDFSGIAQQWADFMDQPGARTALLNAGIALMQPPSFGDTFASQLGRAIGAGGEAATRGEAQAAEVERKEAQAEAARSRAGEAGARLETSIERARMQGRVRLAMQYPNYKAGVESENRKRREEWQRQKFLTPELPEPPYVPLLSPDEFIAQQEKLLGVSIPEGGGRGPSGGGTTRPYMPSNPDDRQPGVVYDTPNGPATWDKDRKVWRRYGG